MSLYVTLTINGYRIDSIDIINQGPPNGEYVDGDWEGGPGVRLYEWTVLPRRLGGTPVVGTVYHRRDEGAHTLASKVLDAVAAREEELHLSDKETP